MIKIKTNTSKVSTALGVDGLLNASQYWNEVKGGKDSKTIGTSKPCTLALKWGTACED